VRISHQPAISDTDRKVNAVLHLETPTGEMVTIAQWSLSVLIWPEEGPKCPQTGTLSVPFQGVDVRFPVRLERAHETNEVLLKGLSGRQRETLALFYRALLSGKMASSSDVITSLDTPVDLVPMEETTSEATTTKLIGKFRVFRVALNIVTYLVLAAFIIGVIGNNILTNLDRIDIQHGRVLAPITELPVPRNGYVESVRANIGETVQAGTTLVQVIDPIYASELKKAEAELRAAEATLEVFLGAKSQLFELETEPALLVKLAGVARIFQDFSDSRDFDDIRRRWINLRDRDPVAAEAFDPLKLTHKLVASHIDIARLEVSKRQAELEGRLALVRSTQIIAQQQGTIREVLVQKGQFLSSGDLAVKMERQEARLTMGWVSERFAETIYIGMPATIGFNEAGESKRVKGTVVDVMAGDHPERPGEFGIIVTIQPSGLELAELRASLRIGAPVNLEAERQVYSRLKAWFASWMQTDV